MKHCMKCGRDYDGRDGDMIDCPYCGEYGGNSWVYGNNGHMHAFSWDTSASGGSYGNASDGGGCAAFLGILFLISLAGPAMSYLWIIIKSIGIFLGCLILFIGLIILWDERGSGKKARSGKKKGDAASSPTPASSPSPSAPTKQTVLSIPKTYSMKTITVTNDKYYKR